MCPVMETSMLVIQAWRENLREQKPNPCALQVPQVEGNLLSRHYHKPCLHLIHLKTRRTAKTLLICRKPFSRKRKFPPKSHITKLWKSWHWTKANSYLYASIVFLITCKSVCLLAICMHSALENKDLTRSQPGSSILLQWLGQTAASVSHGPYSLSTRYTALELIGQPSGLIPAATVETATVETATEETATEETATVTIG